MRVLVTGSRDWPTRGRVAFELNECFDRLNPGERLTVVHGGASRGADFDARTWCLRRAHLGDPVTEERRMADWIVHGKCAGMIRNAEMVEAGADVCLAFIAPCLRCTRPEPHGSHGATHCADLAEKAGIETHRWTP